MNQRTWQRWVLRSSLALMAVPCASAAPGSSLANLNEYGVSMALNRQVPRAESSFVSLLSQKRGDARALNNLGNLSLMKGELAVALSFYDASLKTDSTDAGVQLNRAAAYMLLGDDEQAMGAAARAVHLAGGTDRASELLGLHEPGVDSTRAAEKRFLTASEMRALLHKASKSVPTDSLPTPPASNSERGQGKRTPVWRNGSTRAADRPVDPAEAAALLYWKR